MFSAPGVARLGNHQRRETMAETTTRRWPIIDDWRRQGFAGVQPGRIHSTTGALIRLQDALRIIELDDDVLLDALSSTADWLELWHPESKFLIRQSRAQTANLLELVGPRIESDRCLYMAAEAWRRLELPSPLPWMYEGRGPFVWSIADLEKAAKILTKVAQGYRESTYSTNRV
jgi:hypothetical protein